MKLARFLYKKNMYWGRVQGDAVQLLRNEPFSRIEVTARSIPLKQVRLLPPANPTKIILAGLNYRVHARELKMKIPWKILTGW